MDLTAAKERRRHSPLRLNTAPAIQWATIGIVALLVALPILPIVYQAFLDRPLYADGGELTVSNIERLLADPEFHSAFVNSMIYTLGATLVAQTIGMTVAVLAGRTDILGKVVLTTLVLWPLLVSDLVKALGFSIMYGPAGFITTWVRSLGLPTWNLNSLWGMVIVGGVSQAPLTYLYCIAAVRSMNPALEDAARSSGARPGTVMVRIMLPLLLPAFLASAFVSLISNLESLSIALIFGLPSRIILFPTYLYINSLQGAAHDYGLVASSALVLLVLLVGLVLLQRRLLGDTRRFVTIAGKAASQRAFRLGLLRLPVSAIIVLLMVMIVGVPLVGIVLYAFAQFFSPLIDYTQVMTLANFERIFTRDIFLRAITNSLLISAIGAALATAICFMAAAIVTRTKHQAGPLLDGIISLPRGIAGLIAGLGLFYASVLFWPLEWVRGTIGILIVAFVMRHLPLGYGALQPAMMQISADLETSARAAGASWWRTMTTIVMPLLRPALMATYVIFFLTFFKEYSTAIFLVSPGTEIIGSVMLSLIWESQTSTVAALAVVQIAVAGLFLWLVGRIAKVKLYD